MKDKEQEENEQTIYTEEDVNELTKQWAFKTVLVAVIVGCIIAVLSSTITGYIIIKNKNQKFLTSTETAKKKEVIKSTEAIDDLSQLLSTFAEIIDSRYIGEIDKSTLVDETLKGFINGIGDEYSEYMTAEEWKEYQADALGNYVGVGIYMRQDKEVGYILVESTIKGTPAEKAGIQSGDYILAVDGESIYGENATIVSGKVKGEVGTEVTLTLLRNDETFDITLTREAIKVYHVESKMLEDNIGYVELYTFDEGCAKEFETEVDNLVSQGAKKLIIDLRTNTGGLVSESLDILDLFLDKGEIELITKSANGKEETTASRTDKKYNMPIVVLTNEYTASASEIMTGALKDNGKAESVGTKTYGKGVIQDVYQLTDGSVLKLTTAEYYTPNNVTINKIGIEPDYEVEFVNGEDEDIDEQLEKAIEVIKTK